MRFQFSTVGVIARLLDVPIHKVEYVVRTRKIAPIATAGNARVFSTAQVDRIASELRRIERDRSPAAYPGDDDHAVPRGSAEEVRHET